MEGWWVVEGLQPFGLSAARMVAPLPWYRSL